MQRQDGRFSLRGRESQLILLMLACLFFAELGFRQVEPYLSSNVQQIQAIPYEFSQVVNSDNLRIALIGNSLTHRGVDSSEIDKQLGTATVKAAPDGTAFWDWQCLLRENVLRAENSTVNMVVIGYGWQQLSDQYPANAPRLGGYLCNWSEILAPSDIGLDSFTLISQFAVAGTLRLYASRETLRNRFLDLIIPNYQTFTQKINRAQAPRAKVTTGTESTYKQLRNLANALQEQDIKLIVMAMPVLNSYDQSPGLVKTLSDLEIPLLDYRHLQSITTESFKDEMHLNSKGRESLTDQLIIDISALIEA